MSLPWPPARARVESLVGEWAAGQSSRSRPLALDALVDAILAFHALELATVQEWVTAYKHHHELEHGACRYRDAPASMPATLIELDHVKAELAEWKQAATRDLVDTATLFAALVAEVKTLRAQVGAVAAAP